METKHGNLTMKLECICCKGHGYVLVVNAEFQFDPPQRQACCYCGATGEVKLTVSEAATYAKGQEQNEPPEVWPYKARDENERGEDT